MKELGSEVAQQAEDNLPPNQTLLQLKNGETRCDRTNVPFECSGNQYKFLS